MSCRLSSRRCSSLSPPAIAYASSTRRTAHRGTTCLQAVTVQAQLTQSSAVVGFEFDETQPPEQAFSTAQSMLRQRHHGNPVFSAAVDRRTNTPITGYFSRDSEPLLLFNDSSEMTTIQGAAEYTEVLQRLDVQGRALKVLNEAYIDKQLPLFVGTVGERLITGEPGKLKTVATNFATLAKRQEGKRQLRLLMKAAGVTGSLEDFAKMMDVNWIGRIGVTHDSSDAALQKDAQQLLDVGVEAYLGASKPAEVAIIKAVAKDPTSCF